MSCTCYKKYGFANFLHTTKVRDALVFESFLSANDDHHFSFVLTNPRDLGYHYSRYHCYCPDLDIKPTSSLECLGLFFQKDEEFKLQTENFRGLMFTDGYFEYRALKKEGFRTVGCNGFDEPFEECVGVACDNALECKQTGGIMHKLTMTEYASHIDYLVAEELGSNNSTDDESSGISDDSSEDETSDGSDDDSVDQVLGNGFEDQDPDNSDDGSMDEFAENSNDDSDYQVYDDPGTSSAVSDSSDNDDEVSLRSTSDSDMEFGDHEE